MSAKRFATMVGSLIGIAAIAVPALAAPPSSTTTPHIIGPVAAPDIPGTLSHNYIFFASNHELAAHGYIEEEFFIKGVARTFNTPEFATGSVKDDDHPYLTRIVVRRPADASRFNGTAIVEWNNVSNFFDADNFWFFTWEGLMRAGYVWVGVSTQTIGVDGLKKWGPERYGAFDVGKVVAGSPDAPPGDADAMSFDIFSQVGQVLRHPADIDPLHGLKPKIFIAAGESQSASRLTTYVNSIHPLARVYDGFMLLSVGRKIRADLVSPVFKINTEHDVAAEDAVVRQPDTDKFRSWDVAGTSHVDQHLRFSREALELRDIGKSLEAGMALTCAVPSVGTRVPISYVVLSALDKLSLWAAAGSPPPPAPHITVVTARPRPEHSEIARNSDGLAEGGIQLSQFAVPTQLNSGDGMPSQAAIEAGIHGEAIGPGACLRWGYSLDFTVDQLNARYPTHAGYVARVRQVTDDNLKNGYILPADAATTVQQAEDSHIGMR